MRNLVVAYRCERDADCPMLRETSSHEGGAAQDLFQECVTLLDGPTGIAEDTVKQFRMKEFSGMKGDCHALVLGISEDVVTPTLSHFGKSAAFKSLDHVASSRPAALCRSYGDVQ